MYVALSATSPPTLTKHFGGIEPCSICGVPCLQTLYANTIRGLRLSIQSHFTYCSQVADFVLRTVGVGRCASGLAASLWHGARYICQQVICASFLKYAMTRCNQRSFVLYLSGSFYSSFFWCRRSQTDTRYGGLLSIVTLRCAQLVLCSVLPL